MSEPRTLSDDELNAILADRVTRETAAQQVRITELEAEKADLVRQVETANAATATEKARADKAEGDLAEFKNKVEAEKEIAARQDARLAEAKEIAKHLPEAYWTAERAQRFAGMSDDAWAAYLGDLREQAAALPAGTPAPTGQTRETAMTGTPGGTPPAGQQESTAKVLSGLFGRGA